MDFNSEGLCLLTPNSVLAQKLAASKLPRYYRVRIHGLITDAKLEGLRAGIYVGGRKQAPIQVKVERSGKTISWLKVVTTDSSSKTMKECFGQVHWDITRTVCVGFGPYSLGNVPAGGAKEMKILPEILDIFRSKSST
jgi:23S rRNA pseudouridine2605 synthase